MTTITLSKRDLDAIERSNAGHSFDGYEYMKFVIDGNGQIVDCKAKAKRSKVCDGSHLVHASEIALARFEAKRRKQECTVIPFPVERRAVT